MTRRPDRFTPDFTQPEQAVFTPDQRGVEVSDFIPTSDQGASSHRSGVVLPPEQPTDIDIDTLARQAFEEGFTSGERAGLEVGREKASSYLEAIAEALESATTLRAVIRREAHQELVTLAVAIAERLLRRQIVIDRPLLLQRVQELIAELEDATDVTLRMHPVDLAYAESCREDWRRILSRLHHLRLEETHDLQQGDIRVETPTTSMDARLSTLLRTTQERLLEAVTDALPGDDG